MSPIKHVKTISVEKSSEYNATDDNGDNNVSRVFENQIELEMNT